MRYFVIVAIALLTLGCVMQQDRPAENTKVIIKKETQVVTQPVPVVVPRPVPVIVPRPAPMPPPSHHHGGEHKGGVNIDIDIRK